MKRKRVLASFDYVARTGYGTVSKNIVKELKKHFGSDLQLDIVAVNYHGEPYYEDENTYIVPAKSNDVSNDDFGRFFLLKMLKESSYDGLFICNDLGIVIPFIEVMEHIKKEKLENNLKNFKSIFYFPVDSKLPAALFRNLEFFDLLVTYTEFGRKEVLRHRPELRSKIKVIPHGNSPKDFYPLFDDEIIKFRNEYFEENASKFIITNVNRNQPRKDIPNTIFGFIEAKQNWDSSLPEPFLYLHMHPNDPMGWDLRGIMMQTDLIEGKDYKLLPQKYMDFMAETEVLNKIYNASDVYLSTTLGEGWGLTFTEAAGCCIPVIAPYSASFMEMSGYGKNAYMLYNLYPFCNLDNVIREQTDYVEIAETLLTVAKAKYGDDLELTKEMHEKVRKNFEYVLSLEWSEICKNWAKYFKEVY
jgi:D-inositol-3-phosphate glycosyltransferase